MTWIISHKILIWAILATLALIPCFVFAFGIVFKGGATIPAPFIDKRIGTNVHACPSVKVFKIVGKLAITMGWKPRYWIEDEYVYRLAFWNGRIISYSRQDFMKAIGEAGGAIVFSTRNPVSDAISAASLFDGDASVIVYPIQEEPTKSFRFLKVEGMGNLILFRPPLLNLPEPEPYNGQLDRLGNNDEPGLATRATRRSR